MTTKLTIHKLALIERVMRGEFGRHNLTRVLNAECRGESLGHNAPSKAHHGAVFAWRRIVELGLQRH